MAVTDPSALDSLTSAPQSRRRNVRWLLFLVILLAVAVWVATSVHTAWLYVHETDARITADMISVSSRTSGWIAERPVDAGTSVRAGDVIAMIDDREARIRLTELEAESARIEAEQKELDSRILMAQEQALSGLARERGKLEAAQAVLIASTRQHEYWQREVARAETLFAAGMLSANSIDQTRTSSLRSLQDLAQAEAAVATARAELLGAEAAKREAQVLQGHRETLGYRRAEVEARIERQTMDLADRIIHSPSDGVISRAFVEPGEFVEPGRRMVLLHDPKAIYVEANVRETDIRRIAVGQRVIVEVDAYPDHPFEGTVERIGHAATSQFSLLPSANPSGNFTKVTQRLPVRISIPPQDVSLRPGMMVEVYIDVRDAG